MPTEPYQPILYRELSIVALKDVIDVASPLLIELVNHATNTLIRCADSLLGSVDEDLALLTLYRHVIEMTDGVEVLVAQACAIPAIPLVRSSFEALLSLEYILEDEEKYVQRSLSWLVGYAHQRLEFYERLDPNTEKGKKFAERAAQDFLLENLEVPDSNDISKAISNLESFLAKDHIQPIKCEWDNHRRPNWFQLFNGPHNLYELSNHVNRGGQYDVLYRQWSRVLHSQDLLGFMARDADGDAAIGPLRKPEKVREVVIHASSIMLEATRRVIKKARPDENISAWYKREVMGSYRSITGINPSENPIS